LERRHGDSRLPLVIVPNEGTDFHRWCRARQIEYFHFWGWDTLIAVIDLLEEPDSLKEFAEYGDKNV
jgi:hypothetical protein